IAEILPYPPAEARNHLLGRPLEGADDLAKLLGVDAGGKLRGSHEIADEDGEAPALSLKGAGRRRSDRIWKDGARRAGQLLRVDEAEGLGQGVDRDVASLDLLGGDPLEKTPETVVADNRRDRHGFRVELPEDDLLHRLAAHRRLPGQAFEKD